MDEVQKLLAENLIEGLRQIQAYLVFALVASLSAVTLAFSRSEREEKVTVPILSLPLGRSAATLFLWALSMIGGWVAGDAAAKAYTIALKLRSVPGVLEAAATFPSIATSPMLAFRFAPILLTVVFSAIAVWRQLQREKAPNTAFGIFLVLLLAVYVPLWLQMVQLTRLIGTP